MDDLLWYSHMRRDLEPLAVAYERHVLATFKDPKDVYARLTVPTDDSGQPPMFVPGETLKAAHEAWQHYRAMEDSLKAAQCQPLVGPKAVAAPADTVMERRFTGTYRGRLRDLSKVS